MHKRLLLFCGFLPTLMGWADAYQNLRNLFDFERYEERILSLTNSPGVKVYSIGKSHNGRNLWMIEIPPVSHEQHAILLMGSAHPIEWHAQEIPLKIAEDFIQKKPPLRYRVYILPIFNPDGFAYMKVIPVFYASNRKNRYFPPEEKRSSLYTSGVDLNRNFSYQWQKTSDDPTHPYYSGSQPLSEPETKALKNFVESHHLSLVISFHSPGKTVQYPWGYTKTPLNDKRLISLARSIASTIGNGYRAVQDSANYLKPGCEIDWFYGEYKIPALRIEVSDKLIDRFLSDYPAIFSAIETIVTGKLSW